MLVETLFGAGCGVVIRVWTNALGGQRYLWRKWIAWVEIFFYLLINVVVVTIKCILGPWNLVIMGGIGGYIGKNMEKYQNDMLEDLNVRRVEKGFKPITRSDLGMGKDSASIHYGSDRERPNEVLERGKLGR